MAALLSLGTLHATLLSELQFGLSNGTVPSATPGAKLQRTWPPAPNKFWPHANTNGVPLTYVWIADTLQLPTSRLAAGCGAQPLLPFSERQLVDVAHPEVVRSVLG